MGRAARGARGDSRLSLAVSLCRQRRCHAVELQLSPTGVLQTNLQTQIPGGDSVPQQEMKLPDGNTTLTQSGGQATGRSLLSRMLEAWLVSSKKDTKLN